MTSALFLVTILGLVTYLAVTRKDESAPGSVESKNAEGGRVPVRAQP